MRPDSFANTRDHGSYWVRHSQRVGWTVALWVGSWYFPCSISAYADDDLYAINETQLLPPPDQDERVLDPDTAKRRWPFTIIERFVR
jgi:hypothetical protein